MVELRKGLPDLPSRMSTRPLDERGYPVPWFVHYIEGKPDFRVIRPDGFIDAVRWKKCWVCGGRMGLYCSFVVGPMNVINRMTPEPPSHRECAEFAVKACPYLILPASRRRDKNVPEGTELPAGNMVDHKPTAVVIWITKHWRPTRVSNGYLIEMGPPTEVSWWKEGRVATRDEAKEQFEASFEIMMRTARDEGETSVARLEHRKAESLRYLPRVA